MRVLLLASTILLPTLLIGHSPMLNAKPGLTEATSNIIAAARQYLDTHYDPVNNPYKIGHLDKRIRVARCQQPLDVFLPINAQRLGKTTLGIQCQSPKAWKLYLPVQIKSFGNILVAQRHLLRGSILFPGDLVLKRYELTHLRAGFFSSQKEITQMVARRTIRKGQVLTPGMVQPKRLVRRGDSITIIAGNSNLTIKAKGKALMDGTKGQRIRVKNTNSKREFQAIVIGDGLVRTNL